MMEVIQGAPPFKAIPPGLTRSIQNQAGMPLPKGWNAVSLRRLGEEGSPRDNSWKISPDEAAG